MGNCCLEQYNHNGHLPHQEHLDLPPIHLNPSHQLQLPEPLQPPKHLQLLTKSQILHRHLHEQDALNSHQTTANSILIASKQKSSSTVSPLNRHTAHKKEQFGSTSSIGMAAMSSSQFIPQRCPKEFEQKRQQFLNSNRLFHGLNKSTDVLRMLELAAEANILSLYSHQKSIYMRSITHVELLKNKYRPESIEEVKAYIYTLLANIAITQNNQIEGDTFVVRAIQAYKKAAIASTIEQRISLLNNYSVFKVNCNKLQQASKYLLEAIDLMTVYYTKQDDRKYLSLINLACIQYDRQQHQSAGEIIAQIKRECKNIEIVQLAISNELHCKQAGRQ